jgi:hypothetical protein
LKILHRAGQTHKPGEALRVEVTQNQFKYDPA